VHQYFDNAQKEKLSEIVYKNCLIVKDKIDEKFNLKAKDFMASIF